MKLRRPQGRLYTPSALSQWGTGGGSCVLGNKSLSLTALGMLAHQAPNLARSALKVSPLRCSCLQVHLFVWGWQACVSRFSSSTSCQAAWWVRLSQTTDLSLAFLLFFLVYIPFKECAGKCVCIHSEEVHHILSFISYFHWNGWQWTCSLAQLAVLVLEWRESDC